MWWTQGRNSANALQICTGGTLCPSEVKELQHLQFPCQAEKRRWIQGIQVAPAAEGLCLWKQLFCVPCYSSSELEEEALTLKLIWFTDLMICLNIWKSTSYSTKLNFELDIPLTDADLVRFWWAFFLVQISDWCCYCKWPFDSITMKLDIWKANTLYNWGGFIITQIIIISLLPYYQLGTKGTE